ncbi:MAG: metal-dependent hydrolase [Candidatus Helarchaeota archaeon]
MNEAIHFATGYLLAFGLRYKFNRFECLFLAVCALVPDFDFIINLFFPFEHGVISHTLLGGFLFVSIFTIITWMFVRAFPHRLNLTLSRLLILATFGMLSHLLLDSFTFLPPGTGELDHHLYFWPIWNFPVHINTIFPGATYEMRIWVEIVYCVVVGGFLLLYLGLIRRINVFENLSPWRWNYISDREKAKPNFAEIAYISLIITLIGLEIVGSYIV